MSDDIFFGTAWYIVFLFSTTVHEASHALAALKLGDDTAHRGGQVSLDPTPHIKREPIGMVVVPLISYYFSHWMIGWASAPYDPHWAQTHPRRAGLMAIAGPASNFLLMIIAAILIRVGIAFGWFDAPGSITFTHVVAPTHQGLCYLAAVLLSIMFSLNLLLGCFNLLPLPPLDGSSVPLIFLSESAAEKYWNFMSLPAMRIVGLMVAWNVFGAIFSPIHLFAVNMLYPGIHYA